MRYEAAGTLVTLSSTQVAIKVWHRFSLGVCPQFCLPCGVLFQAAAQCYIELIVKESDNNVKLIVLDRLTGLKNILSHEKVLQELVMDILRVLASPDLEVRKKTLSLVLELVNSRNVDEVCVFLLFGGVSQCTCLFVCLAFV